MNLKNAIREAAAARDIPAEQNAESQTQKVETTHSTKNKNFAANTASSKAVNTAKQKAVKQESREAVKTASVDEESVLESIELAALTIRVPKKSRVHWLVSAKKQNTTLTAAITQALDERFGAAPLE